MVVDLVSSLCLLLVLCVQCNSSNGSSVDGDVVGLVVVSS